MMKNYKPKIERNVAIDEFKKQGKEEEHKNFLRICKNPFIIEELYKRQNNNCPICNHYVGRKYIHRVIHHIDYIHTCITKETIKKECPTPKRPKKTHIIPDCEKCFKEHRENFEECIKRLILVHSKCHKEIHEIDKPLWV